MTQLLMEFVLHSCEFERPAPSGLDCKGKATSSYQSALDFRFEATGPSDLPRNLHPAASKYPPAKPGALRM